MKHLNLVYKGAHSNSLYTAYFDGATWHGNTRISSQPGNINPQSDHNPSAAIYNNWLYMVYKDAAGTDIMCAWFDGTKWNGDVKISAMQGGISPKSNMAPNIAVYHGLLFMVYLDPSSHEVYTSWFDGTTWFGNKKINDQSGGIDPESTYNPAISVYQDTLYIAYTGRYLSNLYTATFDGITWSGNTEISAQPGGISPSSSYSPGMCVYNSRLYLTYLGAHLTNMYTASFDGATWTGNTKISDQPGGIAPASNYNPDVDVYDNKMYLVYKGTWFNDLYTCSFDGTTWRGNTPISAQPGGISPSSNFNPGVTLSAAIPGAQPTWMGRLPDAALISEINIPGTHDSAAINSSITTPYACHNNSISQQLEYGARLLDVRLKITKNGTAFSFDTCHGDTGPNTYQTFPSLMNECQAFLSANPTETVLMSLKVDDWSNAGSDQAGAYAALQSLLNQYPISSSSTLATLGSVRGRIVLFNRMNSTLALGAPIGWSDNTPGSYANPSSNRSYQVYVQDHYKGLPLIHPEKAKLSVVTAAFQQKATGNVVWNFASATWYGVFGVYIGGDLLNYFGVNPAANRLATFGWTLFDYAYKKYNTDTYGPLDIVSLIVASNFQYQGYENTFKVVSDGHGEL